MPANPSLQFAEAVAVIKADDAQLISTLKRDESKVRESVGRMQSSFDKLEVSTKKVGAASGQASVAISGLTQAATLSGSAAAAQVVQLGALALTMQGVSASALIARISMDSLKASLIATTGAVSTLTFGLSLLAAAMPAFLVRYFKRRAAQKELDESNKDLAESELRLAKAVAVLNQKQAQQLQLERQLAVFRGAKPSDFLKGQARKIALELETEQILKRQRELALKMDRERLDAADLGIAKEQQRLRAFKDFVRASKEQFTATAGPQTAVEAAALFKQIFRQSVGRERALEVLASQFAELTPALKQIARGPLSAKFPGLFPDEETERTGQVGFRRVEAFQGTSGSIGVSLDKERNRLLVINNTKLESLKSELERGGLS